MSLYNMMFGRNQYADLLVGILGLGTNEFPVGRFRDCFPNEDGTEIHLYTRNGGGNREQYQFVFDALEKHPNFLGEEDDDYDCTYATVRFSVPEPFSKVVKAIADQTDTRLPEEKWTTLLNELSEGQRHHTNRTRFGDRQEVVRCDRNSTTRRDENQNYRRQYITH